MKHPWKTLRTNMMYWRFRYITRNRLRLRSWWSRRRQPGRPSMASSYPYSPARARGTAFYVHSRSRAHTWIALAIMVVLLTALTVLVNQRYVNPAIVYAAGSLIVVGSVYWALRQV